MKYGDENEDMPDYPDDDESPHNDKSVARMGAEDKPSTGWSIFSAVADAVNKTLFW